MSIDFKAKQLEFATYIRDSESVAVPSDVSKDRMDIYRQLFFNNLDNFLCSTFPVLHQITNDEDWVALVQDFFVKHPCHTPYFSEIPEEFLDYLQNERQNQDDFPFMLELAHYEWAEMALAIAKEDSPAESVCPDGVLQKIIGLSPVAWPLAYQYPVQRISPEFLPEQAPEQPTFLVVYRDNADDVHFLEVTPVTYRLLELVQEHEGGVVAEACLKQLAIEMQHPQPEQVLANGLQVLQGLIEKGVVLVF